MRQTYRAWAEIDLRALEENVKNIRATLPSETAFMAVVKADAYGHGERAVCRKLWDLGVTWYGVSNIEEALSVREALPCAEILILGYTPAEFAPDLCAHNIVQTVFSAEYAKALSEAVPAPVRCHLKIDTGMGRIGFRGETPEDVALSLLPLFELPNLRFEGVFTHFAAADSIDFEDKIYTDMQENFVVRVYDCLRSHGHTLRELHFMNSAASLTRANPRATLARVGIVMYGLSPNHPLQMPVPLHPVMSLHSVVSHVKEIEPGARVSYGRTYVAKSKREIATVTIGYADGFSRSLSGRGYALLHGEKCPIVGRVCMDQTMLDVTDCRSPAHPGDVVTLFGRDGYLEITADEVAALCGTIGYEVVCGVSKRVPRICVGE